MSTRTWRTTRRTTLKKRLLLPRAERARHVSTLDHDRWADAFEEHKAIHEALLARDAERLGVLMEDHFGNGAASIRRERKRARTSQRREAYDAVSDQPAPAAAPPARRKKRGAA